MHSSPHGPARVIQMKSSAVQTNETSSPDYWEHVASDNHAEHAALVWLSSQPDGTGCRSEAEHGPRYIQPVRRLSGQRMWCGRAAKRAERSTRRGRRPFMRRAEDCDRQQWCPNTCNSEKCADW